MIFIVVDTIPFVSLDGIPSRQAVKGNQLGGSFAVELESYVTEDLGYDSSAEVVQTALEDLGNVGTVSVTRCTHL